ncbi:transposase [Streptomyces olivaceoviridis]|uniref:transposase n=1 Tax=Streptomyces olivaceoviridis TaxID=1921 RepID=UPI0033B52D6E
MPVGPGACARPPQLADAAGEQADRADRGRHRLPPGRGHLGVRGSRHYTGTAGKVTNCPAGVVAASASDAASAAVDWRLFLSESWDCASPKTDPAKVARHAKYGTPEEVGHVEEWQLAFGPNRRDEVVSPRGPARHCQRRLRCCILPPRLGRTLP